MRSIVYMLAIGVLFGLGCTRATNFADPSLPMKQVDGNTQVQVQDHPDGFTMVLKHYRYQYRPESDAMIPVGKSLLLSSAHEEAARRGRRIQPINEQIIKMSTGRNGFSGMTTWTGSVRVFYQ